MLFPVFHSTIEHLHMMSQHSNSLATAMAAISENLEAVHQNAAVSMAKECVQINALFHSTDSRQPSSSVNGHTPPCLCTALVQIGTCQ